MCAKHLIDELGVVVLDSGPVGVGSLTATRYRHILEIKQRLRGNTVGLTRAVN